MADSSDVFIVRGSLQLLETDVPEETKTVSLYNAAASVQLWTSDDNYFIVGVLTGAATALLRVSETYATVIASQRLVNEAILHWPSTSGVVFSGNFRIPISKNEKLYFATNGASALTLSLVKRTV